MVTDNRHMRRARRKLMALKGGKVDAPAESTPAERFGLALQAFVDSYLKKHGGLDAMNITKVVMQFSAKLALDHGASREEYLNATGHVYDEEVAAAVQKKDGA